MLVLASSLLALSMLPQAQSAVVSEPTPVPKPTPDGPVIAIDTTMGTVQIGLYATLAPQSTRNFLAYARRGFYEGTIFHRVIPGFMVQGGGMTAKMEEKPTDAPVRNEARNGLSNARGTLAMARTDDPHSATSQFFINVKHNHQLDFGVAPGWGYAVFGEVLSGMDIVDAIVNVPTTTRGVHANVPVTPVTITRVRVISDPTALKVEPAKPVTAVPAVPPPPRTVPPSASKPKAQPPKKPAVPTPSKKPAA